MIRRNRPFYPIYVILFLIIFFIFSPRNTIPSAEAADNPSLQDKDGGLPELIEQDETTGEPAKKKYGEMADDFQEMISKKLRGSANWLDSFFGDERAEIEDNETSLRLRFSSFLEEGEGIDLNTRARLRLVLPQLENKLHIIITGEGNSEGNSTKNRDESIEERGGLDEPTEKNWSLAFRYFLNAAKENNFSINLGASLSDFTPVIYGGPRYSLSKNFDPWLFRFTQEVQWYTDDGWETKTRLDFERLLMEDLFFRTSVSGYWYENKDGYFYNIKFYLYQILGKGQALEYSLIHFFETRPSHELSEILLHVKYRKQFWRKWLFFEIKPQVAFREEDNFEPTPGITFSLEAVFGKKDY